MLNEAPSDVNKSLDRLIPMKNVSFSSLIFFWLIQYVAGYHPGPMEPPRTDGASLGKCLEKSHLIVSFNTGKKSSFCFIICQRTKSFFVDLFTFDLSKTTNFVLIAFILSYSDRCCLYNFHLKSAFSFLFFFFFSCLAAALRWVGRRTFLRWLHSLFSLSLAHCFLLFTNHSVSVDFKDPRVKPINEPSRLKWFHCVFRSNDVTKWNFILSSVVELTYLAKILCDTILK